MGRAKEAMLVEEEAIAKQQREDEALQYAHDEAEAQAQEEVDREQFEKSEREKKIKDAQKVRVYFCIKSYHLAEKLGLEDNIIYNIGVNDFIKFTTYCLHSCFHLTEHYYDMLTPIVISIDRQKIYDICKDNFEPYEEELDMDEWSKLGIEFNKSDFSSNPPPEKSKLFHNF